MTSFIPKKMRLNSLDAASPSGFKRSLEKWIQSGSAEGDCKVWWLTFGVTMVFFIGYPLFKGMW